MAYLFLLYCFCFALLLPIKTVTADDVPSFDVPQSCRRGESIQVGVNPFSACMKKEDEARNELTAQWSQFPQADKTACIQLCNCGGIAGSYIELLTCLQMRTNPEKFLKAPN